MAKKVARKLGAKRAQPVGAKASARKSKPKSQPRIVVKPASRARAKPRSAKGGGDSAPRANPADGSQASRLITQRIQELDDWRGEVLAQVRALILAADPGMVEEWKWMGTPVWSCNGILCTGESYAKVVKLTFAKGAKLEDPACLFNSSLEGNTRRAIDIHEGERVNAPAFQQLVRAAVALNASSKPKSKPR